MAEIRQKVIVVVLLVATLLAITLSEGYVAGSRTWHSFSVWMQSLDVMR